MEKTSINSDSTDEVNMEEAVGKIGLSFVGISPMKDEGQYFAWVRQLGDLHRTHPELEVDKRVQAALKAENPAAAIKRLMKDYREHLQS